MPFPENPRLISVFLENLRHRDLGSVESIRIRFKSVEVAVLSRQNDRPTWCTKRIGYKCFIKNHSFFRKSVDIGGHCEMILIGADGLISMIIRHDKDN